MRMGLVSYDFYPPIGGQGVEAYDLYRALQDQEEVDVVVFSSRENDIRDHVTIPARGVFGAGQFHFSLNVNRRISEVISGNRLDLLQIYGGPGGVLFFRTPRVPLVYVANHTYAQQYRYLGRPVYKPLMRLERIGYRRAQQIVAISTTTKESLVDDYKILPEKITVIPIGVDTSVFKPEGVKRLPASVLFVGRFCERKGLPLLIDSLKDVKSTRPDVTLYMVGEGELRSELQDHIERLRLSENVVFLGRVSGEELVKWYNRAEVLVVPSIFEGFGIVCIEAMACGTPVIATEGPGVVDIIDNQRNGILVKRDQSELAGAITKLLGDGELRDAMGWAGRKDVLERFNWEVVAEKFSSIYREISRNGSVDAGVEMSSTGHEFGEDYFESLSGTAILKGRKPFYHGFWTRYLRGSVPSGRLLDLGCGRGYFLSYAEKYYETVGIDISEFAIQSARQVTERSELHVGDAAELAFSDGYFDVITCFDLLEHSHKPELVIRECNRALRKNGLIVLSVPNTGSLGRRWKKGDWFGYRDSTHVSVLTNEKWLEILRSNGFEIKDTRYDGLWDSPYFSRAPKAMQHLFFKFPFSVLFGLGIRFPKGLGENLCIVAKKR